MSAVAMVESRNLGLEWVDYHAFCGPKCVSATFGRQLNVSGPNMVNWLTIMGALSLVGGGIGYFAFPAGLKFGIKSTINLKEGGMVYPTFMDPPFAATSTYYFYEIKNPK